MLKPMHENENKPTSHSKIKKHTQKQENKSQNIHKTSNGIIPPKEKTIYQTSSKNKSDNDHSYRYQLLSSENNLIVLKKIKSFPV
mgnify:CR=1 FL=1